MSLWLLGCAASAANPAAPEARSLRTRRTIADLKRQMAAAEKQAKQQPSPSELAEQDERKVDVAGLVGTLSQFDVKVTMEKKSKEFAQCHEPRARSVPSLAGSIEFKIHVLKTGKVSKVQVRESDLGDRVLERCLSEVIKATPFPEPNGGEADVQWNMLLAPLGRAREPEQWEHRQVERVVRKHRAAMLATCDARGNGQFSITAYVARSGRVLAAGVAAREAISEEQFDCIADELRSWTMPKPRTGVAKVRFPIRTGA
jgi:hypothetical protein